MAGFGGHLGWGGMSEPADRLRGPVEVPPAGVGLYAARHPGHRDGVSTSGGQAAGDITPGPLSGGNIPDTWEVDHQYSSKVFLSPNLLRLPGTTGWRPVSSQDASLQRLAGRLSLGWGDHDLFMREGREDISRRHMVAADKALGEARAAASTKDN